VSAPEPLEGYRPLRRRALYARIALAAMVAVDLVAVFSDLREYFLLQRLESDVVGTDEIEASDRRQQIVAVGQLVVFAVTAGFFIAWLHRAHSNLFALGAQHPRYSRATAIWSWFVPILNLWRPKQVINDVWRATDPDAPIDQGDSWRQRDPPVLYAVWWLVWVALNFAYNADLRIYLRAETLEDFQFSSLFTTASDALSVLGALLALAVVRRTTTRHEARVERLRSMQDEAAEEGRVSLPGST
jgi:Domain of unknown function (DUF4328)